MKNKKPKILVIDYETSPQIGYFWGGIWETNIVEVIEYEQILSVAWKWNGEDKVNSVGQCDFSGYKKDILNDKKLCEFFSNILNEADIIVAHNGDQFDMRVFNARLLFWNLDPISTIKTFDTKKISKNKFHLPSNKLNDIADFLGIGEKLHHSGFVMWKECRAGVKKSWNLMKKYNKQDVVLLDKILVRLMPFSSQLNTWTRIDEININCSNPLCCSDHLVRHDGRRRVVNGWRTQYQCMDCGKYTTDTKTTK